MKMVFLGRAPVPLWAHRTVEEGYQERSLLSTQYSNKEQPNLKNVFMQLSNQNLWYFNYTTKEKQYRKATNYLRICFSFMSTKHWFVTWVMKCTTQNNTQQFRTLGLKWASEISGWKTWSCQEQVYKYKVTHTQAAQEIRYMSD